MIRVDLLIDFAGPRLYQLTLVSWTKLARLLHSPSRHSLLSFSRSSIASTATNAPPIASTPRQARQDLRKLPHINNTGPGDESDHSAVDRLCRAAAPRGRQERQARRAHSHSRRSQRRPRPRQASQPVRRPSPSTQLLRRQGSDGLSFPDRTAVSSKFSRSVAMRCSPAMLRSVH